VLYPIIVHGALKDGMTSWVPTFIANVFSVSPAASSLLSTFADVFSADAAQKGLSLLARREGEQIAAACVSLIDDPFHEKGMSGKPFDAEGVATQKKALIEGGQLKTLLHNLKTAHKQGVQTTANASKGSYAAPVAVAPSNLFFAPGEKTPEEILEAVGDGLLITEFEGMHAGANTITGDFSLGAKGYKVEGGKKTSAVNQITVAGNFFGLLSDIEAFGADLTFEPSGGASAFGSPTALVKALSVAGV
jgi:PmbA protein